MAMHSIHAAPVRLYWLRHSPLRPQDSNMLYAMNHTQVARTAKPLSGTFVRCVRCSRPACCRALYWRKPHTSRAHLVGSSARLNTNTLIVCLPGRIGSMRWNTARRPHSTGKFWRMVRSVPLRHYTKPRICPRITSLSIERDRLDQNRYTRHVRNAIHTNGVPSAAPDDFLFGPSRQDE